MVEIIKDNYWTGEMHLWIPGFPVFSAEILVDSVMSIFSTSDKFTIWGVFTI